MQRIVTAGQMKDIDRKAMSEWGIPGIVLMENAGRAVADALEEALEPLDLMKVAVVCGKGNNGGDGFVAARHLLNRGIEVECMLLGSAADLTGDARTNADILLKSGIPLAELTGSSALAERLADAEVIIDAIFGTGLDTAPRDLYAEAIDAINENDCFVLAVDVPSGVDADSGGVPGSAVDADLTVTMGLPKQGLLLYPGRACCGDIEVADIGIPEHLLNEEFDTALIEDEDILEALPDRPENSHKGTFGTALIVAGARGFSGAACLAGSAAVRAGAGLVKLAYPESVTDIVESGVIEAIKVPVPGTEAGTLALVALDQVLAHAGDARAVAIGPGITTNPETQELVLKLLPALTAPVVIDADGLNNLAGHLDVLSAMHVPAILTPHPGELSRLTGRPASEIDRNRVNVARDFAREHGVFLVLKGAPTVVATPTGIVFVNSTGNSGLASGGTGDVLTGLITGLLSQGADPLDAALAGVFLHGRAADIAADDVTEYALCAGDVIDYLPDAFDSVLDPAPE